MLPPTSVFESAALGMRGEVHSILQAITLLGEDEVGKWLILTSAVMACADSPELVRLALIRGRFAESLSAGTVLPPCVLFFTGLLSRMDAILGVSLPDIVEQIAISPEIRSALLRQPGILRDDLDLVVGYERGDGRTCDRICTNLRIEPRTLASLYLEALKWAESLINR